MSGRPISEVLEARTPELMRIPGVVGTGEGARDGTPVILVLVDRVTPEIEAAVPGRIDGYDVEIRPTGQVKALEGDSTR